MISLKKTKAMRESEKPCRTANWVVYTTNQTTCQAVRCGKLCTSTNTGWIRTKLKKWRGCRLWTSVRAAHAWSALPDSAGSAVPECPRGGAAQRGFGPSPAHQSTFTTSAIIVAIITLSFHTGTPSLPYTATYLCIASHRRFFFASFL